jgi:photosystem II stability/assembly factor-like uncharacterized protein
MPVAREFCTDVLDRGSSQRLAMVLIIAVGSACAPPAPPAAEPATASTPADSQHAGITTPHGDHAPHHGGIVLMKDELHYEVVLDRAGRHAVWFTNAVRQDLPASVASKVEMVVTRPNASPEALILQIDDQGESWTAAGQPIAGEGVTVRLTFTSRGEPFEIEIPFVSPPPL